MSLTKQDATVIMGMLARGDKNQDIAAWFGENPARIVEVEKGETFGIVPAAPANALPPKGAVGPKGRKLRAFAADALQVLQQKGAAGVAEAIKELSDGLARFDRHES
jgi:hypothetical protein